MNSIIVRPDNTQLAMRTREEEIDVRTLFGILAEHKWPVLIGTALCFVAGLIYVLVATPVYQATAVVQVEKSAPAVPGQEPGTPSTITAQAVTEVPLITSRRILGQAIENLGLDIEVKPERFPLIGDFMARRHQQNHPGSVAPPWAGLDRYGWGGEKLEIRSLVVPDYLLDRPLMLVAGPGGTYTLQDDDGRALVRGGVGQVASGSGVTVQVQALAAHPGTRFEVKKFSTLAIAKQIRSDLEAAEQGRESGIIALSYENPDPALAAKVLEQITSLYVKQNLERTSAEAEGSLKFVNEQLPKVRDELDKAQGALNEFQKRHRVVDAPMQTKAILDQTVALSSAISQLRVQQAEVGSRFTAAHPVYRSLMQQIGHLQGEKAALEGQLNQMPDIQRGLFKLNRDVEVTNQTYTNLLNQAQQLDIARASAIGNVHVVDRPAVDLASPVWPMKLPIVVGATLLGGLLTMGFVLFRQAFNRKVRGPDQVEQLGLPVYASIFLSEQERYRALRAPESRRLEGRQQLLALKAPSDMAMEALRGLRTSLHFARMTTKNNLLMIAGPTPGVGKTFVCSNLGVTIAQTGQRVLLIDADMRRGNLHEVVGGRPEDGLSELISGQIQLETAIRPVVGAQNLSFISRGRIPPNPSELLMHANFAALMQRLAPLYDLIIIDTPPVLAVTDAAVIGQHVGTSFLVVRCGMNQSQEIALAQQRLEQNGVEVKGAIVNAVQKRTGRHYIYSYYEHRPSPGPSRRAAPWSSRDDKLDPGAEAR